VLVLVFVLVLPLPDLVESLELSLDDFLLFPLVLVFPLVLNLVFPSSSHRPFNTLKIMVVKIRLARFGRRNSPFYNIVVAHARTARNSRPLEVIGTYDPIPKPDPYDDSGKLHEDVQLGIPRAKYWVGVGAQPTDTAWRLLSMVGVVPKKDFAPAQVKGNGTVSASSVRIR